MSRRDEKSRRERGQVVVVFALMIPMFLALGAFVIGIGNWYVHGKHLQTKADAGAFAGGGSWEFPCGTQIDARIAAAARLYAGSNNPQVGKVPNSSIRSVLNGPDWYDDDSNPAPIENLAICNAMFLDVKVTEDNSFPLASLIPLFPDIKRKARVEIRQGESFSGLLPIAVRAPEPVSAAVFYDEATGDIKRVRYFVKRSVFGLPGSLQGWSTENTEDGSLPAQFTPSRSTGVAIAISLRGACNTNLPTANTKIIVTPTPCFEDEGFSNVDSLCNQGGAAQIVECYFASGGTVQSGLQFIRGYHPTVGAGVGEGQPDLRSAWLENLDCPSNGYFSSVPGASTCQVKLKVVVDIGSKDENPPPNPPDTVEQTRTGQNTEVKYCLVLRGQTAATACSGQFGTAEEMQTSSGGPGEVEFTTVAGKHLVIPRNSQGAAVAIQVRMKDTTIAGEPGCNFVTNNNFNNNCRFFYTGAGFTSTSVPPSGAAILAAPVQRSFRGSSVNSSSVRWLRLTATRNCTGTTFIDNEAASQPTQGGDSCFFLEMGLKGGLALDADEEPFVFNDGSGKSQTGAVDCDPTFSGQGSDIRLATVSGCSPFYARHPFDWDPPCPAQNDLFNGYPAGNPGSPWGDADTPWPPLRCIKTRTTGNPSQFETGFDDRFFSWFDPTPNPGCPSDAAGFVKGRNYWDQDNNPLNNGEYGYKDDSPARDTKFNAADPRVVTIFLTTSDAFTSSGQEAHEITGFVQVYVTGYGKLNGSGNLTPDDPCPGSTPPPVSEYDCSGSDCGYIVWGHFIKYAVPNPQATPTLDPCDPLSAIPCVATLVE